MFGLFRKRGIVAGDRVIKGYRDREENKCWCGAGLITFYSRKHRQCVDLENCGRIYDLYDGVEIKHQR